MDSHNKHNTDTEAGVQLPSIEDKHPEEAMHIEDVAPEWNPEEEKALVRRVDIVVMPLLLAGFFVLQLDRLNIGNALTDFFFRDVGITQFQFNIGKQLMYCGIVILEIPSNIVLYRVGPAVWIGCQIFAWGLVATFQAFQKGVGAHLATSFLLGCCEAGYIPAGLYTITRFYTRDETSKRFAWFYIGSMFASAVSGLIAYGILHMRGVAGLAGWQWLFILEGLLTIVIAILFIVLFPKSTTNPTSILGLRYFTEREAEILTARVIRDDPSKKHARARITRKELTDALLNWRNIPHIVMTLCTLAATTSLFSYAPSIVASYGFGRLRSNAMVSIGQWILLVTTLSWGWMADKWGRRGPLVFFGVMLGWIFIVANRAIVDHGSNNSKFAILTLITGFSYVWHPVNGSWMALNARSAGERSVTMAIFAMSANASGIIGGQIFQASDAPQYRNAWTIIMALSCLGLAMAITANLQYWWLNRRLAKKGETDFRYKP